MIDLDLVRREPEKVEENLARRRNPEYVRLFAEVRSTDAQWRAALRIADELRRRRNELSRRMADARAQGGGSAELTAEAKSIPEKLKATEAEEGELLRRRDALLRRLPNLLDASVPYGKDDSENVVLATWGTPTTGGPGLKSHAEVLEGLGMADFDRAHRVSGGGFYYLSGAFVLLDLALQRFALDLLIAHGFTPVAPPYLLRRAPYEGVTDLADFENVMYKIEGEDLYLIATSEHPLAALHQGEILDEDTLPLRLAGISPCFRKEIGGHGVDQKGIFRVHQFQKVEQFVFCQPQESPALLEELRANAEEVFRRLDVPYRVVNVCTGDIGSVASKKYQSRGLVPPPASLPRGSELLELHGLPSSPPRHPPRKGRATRQAGPAHPQLDRGSDLPGPRGDPRTVPATGRLGHDTGSAASVPGWTDGPDGGPATLADGASSRPPEASARLWGRSD